MAKIYRCQLEVRGYELDSFGHVNHAEYLHYLEFARWKMLAEEGMTLAQFQTWKRWPVIAGVEIKYLKPTFMGEILEVETTVVDHGKVDLRFEQTVKRGDDVILRAKVHSVVVNEKGRPADVPEPVQRLWS